MAQRVMIVEVFVAQGKAEEALADQGLAALRITLIAQAAGHGLREAHLTVDLTKQQDATVGGDVTAIEASDDLAAFAAWK